MDRVESQAVDVKVADPSQRALQDPLAHRVGARVVVIDGLAPEGRVAVGQVGPEGLECRDAARADVVVDDVEHHGDARSVCRVDEGSEGLRAAVAAVRRRQIDPVVAPAAHPREVGHRHQLDGRDAELRERRQSLGGRREGALLGEGANVELIEHELAQCRRTEALVAPLERRDVQDA
jgi:hypothetical protein